MFLSRNKKNNVYSCKPQFYYIKVGFTGVKIIQVCFRDGFKGKTTDEKSVSKTNDLDTRCILIRLHVVMKMKIRFPYRCIQLPIL